MENNGPFGFDPDDIDRVVREASEGLRDAFGRFLSSSGGQGAAFGGLFDEFTRHSRPRSQPETAGEAGDGVWAIYTTDAAGKAHVEQVYRNELDALRANKHNTDPPPATSGSCRTALTSACSTRPRIRTAPTTSPSNYIVRTMR